MRDVKRLSLMLATSLCLTTLDLATPVLADPQAATSQAAPSSDAPVAQPAAVQADDTDAQIAAFTNGPAQPQGQPQGDGAAPPRQIHGEAGVGFGSRGYREGYVYADIPVGQHSDLGVGVDDTQFKTPRGRSVDSKSLALSLTINTGGDRGAGGCRAATMPMDGRYLEPMWTAQAHGEALARDQADCEAAQAAAGVNAPPSEASPTRAAE